MGSLCRMGLQKRKFLFQTSRGWHHCVCFSTIAHSLLSALMYMDCMHVVMLKPASVYFTFISDYGYLV